MAYEDAGVRLVADGAAQYLNTLERIEAAHDVLVGGVRALADGVNRIDDVFAAATRKIQQFGERGDSAAKAARDLADAEGDTATAAAKMASATDKADDKTGDLEKAAEQAAAGVDDLGDAARKAADPIGDAGKAADKAGDEADDLDDKSRKGGKGLDFLGEAATGAVRKLGELAVDGLQEVAQAAADFAVDTVKAAGDFESGMNTFSATVGQELDQSGMHLEDFRDLFISLGRDLPVSTAEVQQAAIEMSKGGIDPATIAAGGLQQALQFAAASGLGLAEAATISAKVLQGWVPLAASADEKTRFFTASTDLLTKATTAAATNVDQLSLGLFNVQGTAQGVGLSFEDTVTTLALLTPSFSSSATAGDSMKNMLTRLIPQSVAATEKFKELNLLTSEGKSIFYDASGAFIGMRNAAGILQEKLGSLSAAERSEALAVLFGNDAKNAANVLIRAGAAGYDEIVKKIAAQNGVLAQATLKQQGWNVAVDNLMGSLEALQITLGTTVLPSLTAVVELLAGGVNAITDYAAATVAGDTALASIADTAQTLAMPAIYGVAAATTAYGLASAAAAIGGVGQLGVGLALIFQQATLAAPALLSAAAGAAALALPLTLIGATIALVKLNWDHLNETIETATQDLLNSHPAWVATTDALTRFNAQTTQTRDQTSSLAGTVEVLRGQIESDVEALGKHATAYETFGVLSGYTRESLEAERQAINAKGAALTIATNELNKEIDAAQEATVAGITATGVHQQQTDALANLGQQISFTQADLENFTKTIQENSQKGQEAIQAYATTESEFLSAVEQRRQEHEAKLADLQRQGNADAIKAENESYAAQEQAAAESYSRQQAAQQAHLGQMLADYVVAQAQMGKISGEKALELTRAIEEAYGIQKSSVASTYLSMTQTIDAFAADQSQSIDGVVTTLQEQQQQAVDTQKAMDNYATVYTAEAVANFVEKGQEADDYAAALRDIPTKAATAVTSTAPKATQEVDAFHDHLDAIPRTIHVNVDVDIPDVVTPHSPTPFEIGLWGIRDAMAAVGDIAKLTGDKLKEAFAHVADSFSWAAAIPRAQEDMDAFIRSLTSQEGVDLNFLLAGGGGALDRLGGSAMKDFTQALADAEKLRGLGPEGAAQADRFLQERIDQIKELADLQRQLLLATDDTKRKEIETSIERISSAQMNELMATLAAIPGIEEFLKQLQGRAAGGNVSAGRPYMVGEQGRPELFIPGQSGSIVPEDRIVRAMASMAQMAAMGGQQTINNYYGQVGHSLTMPVQTNLTPSAIQQSAEIAWSMLP